jgi:hypothetical protein
VSSFLRLSNNDVATASILLGIPSFVRPNRAKGAKAVGLRYEKRVLEFLASKHKHFVASPWFRYTLRNLPNRINYAQPDGMFIDISQGLITLVEIKYAHTADAYFQLVDKYVPIVSRFFNGGDWRIAVCEVVSWYDGATAFPTQVRLLDDPLAARPGFFGVHIARP